MTTKTFALIPRLAYCGRLFCPAIVSGLAIVSVISATLSPRSLSAASPAGPLVTMFQAGRVPAERAGTIIEMIGKRGNGDDLAFLLQMAASDKYDAAARSAALEALLEAATSRNVKPSGDLGALRTLLAPAVANQRHRFVAVRLAGLWHVTPLADALAAIALDDKANPPLRQAAAVGLGRLKIDSDRQTFDRLLTPDKPVPVRLIGVEGLAQHDLDAAAAVAAKILSGETDKDDPAPLVDIFIGLTGGTDRLAAAIEAVKPSAPVARRALEHLYAIGRADGKLPVVLSAVAGVTADMHLPDTEEVRKLVAEVEAQGDAARGEAVFRRATLSCMKCHAVSGGGGNVGPDLSSVGGISPVEYLITSVLAPE
ncbi:MAG TPA: hypothetical protein VMF30_16440, partial [Pirellulales bacterium]|nr:hypothetical protein [Pirellulales bacterium]